MNFTEKQRYILWDAAAIGLFRINGLFLFATFFRTKQVSQAYNNLYAMTFIIEAFVLLPFTLFFYIRCKTPVTGLERNFDTFAFRESRFQHPLLSFALESRRLESDLIF